MKVLPPFGQSRQPTLVGQLLIPLGHGCAFHRISGPVKSPDGRPVALLRPVPAGFDRSVEVLFTPCGEPKRKVRSPIPPADRISFKIESEVRYSGHAGSVIILLAKPSEPALRPGLNLGNPAGTLPNGTRLFAIPGDVRWLHYGLIISVSGNVPIETLKRLTANVVVS